MATSDWTSRLSALGRSKESAHSWVSPRDFDELGRDAHAIAFGADRALDEVVRAQRIADLAHRAIGALDPVTRRARDHAEPVGAQASQLRHELLGQPAGERSRDVRLAQVAEGEDGEPLLGAARFGQLGAARAVHALDARDEAVAAPVQGLDEARPLGVVAEHGSQPLHGGVQAVLEVDECPVRPETIAELVTRQQFARMFEHHRQHGERLVLQPESDAVLAQLSRP